MRPAPFIGINWMYRYSKFYTLQGLRLEPEILLVNEIRCE